MSIDSSALNEASIDQGCTVQINVTVYIGSGQTFIAPPAQT